jgi:hypothetical protein
VSPGLSVPFHLLFPSASDLAGWGAVALASIAFIGLGRIWSAGRALPEVALVAGWGVLAFVLTLWGALVPLSLVWPGALLTVLGVAAAPWRSRAFWQAVGRLLVLALPLLALLSSARPSQPDTFLNLLPNAAYLWDHGAFPADDRAPSYSLLPGAPYNLQLAGFVASLIAERFSANALIAFNVVLQLAFALFLARVIGGTEDADAPPSWRAIALGLLLTMALNPGFVPRYHVSSYSEAAVTVCLAIALSLGARALARMTAGEDAGADLRLLAPTLAALVNVKQDSVALVAGLAVAMVALALWQSRGRWLGALAQIMLAALPAVMLYLLWRWYVLGHFAVGELKLLPPSAWQASRLPAILYSMAGVVIEKPYFFIAVAVALGALIRRWRRLGFDQTTAIGALFAAVLALYNGALLFTYVAHFEGEIGAAAHSYFRYNTHLGLSLVLSLVLMAREANREHRWQLSARVTRLAAVAVIAAVLATPLAFLGYLRFDLEPPQQRAWFLADRVRAALRGDERLALILPGDNGSLDTMLEGIIRLTAPRHPSADLRAYSWSIEALDQLHRAGYPRAIVSCMPSGFPGLAPGQITVLEYEGPDWRTRESWSYPDAPRRRRWSHVVAEPPLCL